MTGRGFPHLDERSATESARLPLTRARQRFGTIPAPLARYATAPILLEQAEAGLAAFERTSLTPIEREVVALTVARRNGCGFCIEFHRGLVQRLGASQEFFDAMVAGQALSEPRLEALRRFTVALLDTTGDVGAEHWGAFIAHGFTHQHALEVVLGIGVYTLTTFSNRLTEVDVPAPRSKGQ